MNKYISNISLTLVTLSILSIAILTPFSVKAEPSSCFTFSKNLGKGSVLTAQESKTLEEDLVTVGVWNKKTKITTYNSAVATAVSKFQEKYSAQILKPSGLKKGNGYIGVSTRKKLNSLHPCSIASVSQSESVSTSSSSSSQNVSNVSSGYSGIAQCPSGYVCTPVSQYQNFVCPSGYNCTLNQSSSSNSDLQVVSAGMGLPSYTPSSQPGVVGYTEATIPMSFTVKANNSPIYISANPKSAVSIISSTGIGGTAQSVAENIYSNSSVVGDTNAGSTGSFMVPANSSRTFTVTSLINNLGSAASTTNASLEIPIVYYSLSPTASGSYTDLSTESLYKLNSGTLRVSGLNLLNQ